MFDLENITDPSFVKDLSIKELKILAKEIRETKVLPQEDKINSYLLSFKKTFI